MLKGIFSANDESKVHFNDGSKSPRTIAIEQLQVETGYFEIWGQMNQQYIDNTQQMAALKEQHKTESFDLDQDASDELWETNFLPKVKALEEAQSVLEETRKKLETEKSKVISVN
jgi:hypothetical protein